MKICSICHKISATEDDHLNCKEMRRVELEDKELKQKLAAELDMNRDVDLDVEVKAILDHLTREKEKTSD